MRRFTILPTKNNTSVFFPLPRHHHRGRVVFFFYEQHTPRVFNKMYGTIPPPVVYKWTFCIN